MIAIRALAVLMFAVLALSLAVGCEPGWKRCEGHLWIYKSEEPPDFLNFASGARYRIIKTDPLTVEYDGYEAHTGNVKGVAVATRVECM